MASRIGLYLLDHSVGSSTVDGSIPSSIPAGGLSGLFDLDHSGGFRFRRIARRGRWHCVIDDFRFRPDSDPRLALGLATLTLVNARTFDVGYLLDKLNLI